MPKSYADYMNLFSSETRTLFQLATSKASQYTFIIPQAVLYGHSRLNIKPLGIISVVVRQSITVSRMNSGNKTIRNSKTAISGITLGNSFPQLLIISGQKFL